MKAKYLLVAAMGLLLGLSTSASAHSAVQSADIFAAAFPAGTEPVVDGDLGEWEWIRESSLRDVYTLSARDFNYQARGGNPDGLTEDFFPAGDNTNLDDFNFNMTLGYTPGTNMLYLGIEDLRQRPRALGGHRSVVARGRLQHVDGSRPRR